MNESQTEQEARNLVARLYADWRWSLKKKDSTWPDIQAGLDKLIEDVKEQVENKPVAAEAVGYFRVMRERAAEFVTVPPTSAS